MGVCVCAIQTYPGMLFVLVICFIKMRTTVKLLFICCVIKSTHFVSRCTYYSPWKFIHSLLPSFSTQSRLKVGNDTSFRFWEDVRCGPNDFASLFPIYIDFHPNKKLPFHLLSNKDQGPRRILFHETINLFVILMKMNMRSWNFF